MTKFNTKKPSTKTVNLAGGKAHKESNKLELASILITTFLQDGFYRSANETVNRIKELTAGLPDKLFAAQAAIYARKEHGIRSATHLVAAEIGKLVKGEEWTKRFFNLIVKRPDDITEILACYAGQYGKPIPNSMKKGFAKAVSAFPEYQLAKYRGEGNDVSMVDVVNLVHPRPSKAVDKLVNGTLKNTKTWEAKLSEAGREAEDEEDAKSLKGQAWSELLKEEKLGYFALIRNLRNMLEQLPDKDIKLLIKALKNKDAIKKSLVLPFRFLSAYQSIQNNASPATSAVMSALAEGMDTSLSNVPSFKGKTCIMLDTSGSMTSAVTRSMPVFDVAAIFTAILAKNNNADIIGFSNDAYPINVNTHDSVMSIVEGIKEKFVGGGTNLTAAFEQMTKSKREYDRIIILSDMQAWMDEERHKGVFKAYKSIMGCEPKVFSFDLAGLGTLQFPEKNVYCLAGWSDKSLDILKHLDKDQQAFLDEIEAIVI